MLSLGLDLSEHPARAVVIDDAGTVIERATGDTAADAARAVTASHKAERAGAATSRVGERVTLPGFAAVTTCAPGFAALTAEAWIGGARGARHAVFLHIRDQGYARGVRRGKTPGRAPQRARAP